MKRLTNSSDLCTHYVQMYPSYGSQVRRLTITFESSLSLLSKITPDKSVCLCMYINSYYNYGDSNFFFFGNGNKRIQNA